MAIRTPGAALALVACAAVGLNAQNASSLAPATDLARGEPLYGQTCAPCHGPAGEGGRGPTLAVPRLPRAPDLDSLVKLLREGLSGTEMPRARLSDADVRHVAAWVLKLGDRPVEHVSGDAARGERVYSTKGGCATCHTINGQGGAFGPDLTDIGRRRGAAHLRTSMLDPQADVPRSFSMYRSDVSITQNFLQVRVTTKEGRQFMGARVNEDSFTIQLRDAAGRVHSFFKSELTELHKDWGRSPMPSFVSVFSPQELDDIVAFLLTLRGGK
jgi:putative heme-binding domain-containing protein